MRRVVTNNYEGRPSQGPQNRNSFFRRRKKYVKRNMYRKRQPCQGFQNWRLDIFNNTNKQLDSDNRQKTFPQTHAFTDQWKKLADDQDVLQIVSGYYLEFDQEPMQTAHPTAFKLSRPEERLVDQETKKLLKKGAMEVVEHAENQFLLNIFTVPKKDGTRRPVIDLRQLNHFVKKVPFKMEDLTQIPSVLQKGDFLCKIDLQDAYLTIAVAKKVRVYFWFLWKVKLYQFTCLPFGLASSPRIFTKCLKPLLVYLRALGVHLLVYLDDFLIMAPTKEQRLEQAQLIIGLLEKLGYLINQEKSVLEPTQRLNTSGF